jgi:hypothetical protein
LSPFEGKFKLGAFGVFIPGIALVGAVRLGKPSSLWARRFYDDEALRRSHERAAFCHARYSRWTHHFYDFIGGAPDSQPSDPRSVSRSA